MMKFFFLLTTLSIMSFARLNPFEPTQTFIDLKNKHEQSPVKISEISSNNIKKEDTNCSVEKHVEKRVVVVKKKSNCKNVYKFMPLKFVNIDLKDDFIKINVAKKYKLINSIISDDNTKFVYDFKGKVTFYTIRKKLCSEYFDSFALGTHLEDNFFRVVIKVKKDIKEYKENKLDSIIIKY